MTTTKPASQDDERAPTPSVRLGERHVRALRIAVIVMSIVLVVGLITVLARIGYLITRSGPAQTLSEPLAPEFRATLPAGAQIRQVTLNGNRLAIHYDTSAGAGISILDLGSGRSLSRITIVPEAPR